MFDNFPYTNFHELNLDWIIKIAKDFLDQYTHIQETIQTGLDDLDAKATELSDALTGLYNGYSEDLEEQLRNALADLNDWYTQHSGYLDNILAQNVASFQTQATAIGQTVIDSIPEDYTKLAEIAGSLSAENENLVYQSAQAFFYDFGYFDASLNFVANSGIALLKIPIGSYRFVILSGTSDFMEQISGNYRFTYQKNNDSLDRTQNTSRTYGTAHTDGNYEAAALGYPQTKFVYITVNATKIADVQVIMDNSLYNRYNGILYPKGIYTLNKNNCAVAQTYFDDSQIAMLTISNCLWKSVCTGDVIDNIELVSGISYYGSYMQSNGSTRTKITNSSFTAPGYGYVCIFNDPAHPQTARYIPASANRFKLYASDIIGGENENSYYGLNGVAFGTSLTYRSQSTGGYLNYLPTISGMNWDNQGTGSGTIKKVGASNGLILESIKNYTGYANKRVAIIEGFVNDFGYNPSSLGVYTDSSESTVCGCIRVAINYILAQNPNITIFLVLDHYGRNYNGTDSSSTSKNSNNQTQFEWWNEIAKVAESLGVPVIPLYKISGISENTPQYLMDNIHPTTLGAMQTAYSIWECMKQYFPNQVST